MRLGKSVRELRDSLAAFIDYIVAITERAAAIAVRGSIRPSIVVAVFFFITFTAAVIVLGDRLWGGRAYHIVGVVQRRTIPEQYLVDVGGLTNGQLCRKYVDLERGQSIVAVSKSGRGTQQFKCPTSVGLAVSVAGCGACVEVEENSENDALAGIRRQMIKYGAREGIANTTVLAPGFLAFTIVFLVSLGILGPVLFLTSSIGALRRLFEILRSTLVPPRLKAWNSQILQLEEKPVLAQISDLHVTSFHNEPYELRGLPLAPRAEDIRRRIVDIVSEIQQRSIQAIAISGDITDAGHESEWASFKLAIDGRIQCTPNWIVCAGNHDNQINIEFSTNGERTASARRNLDFDTRRQQCNAHMLDIFGPRQKNFRLTLQTDRGRPIDVFTIDSCNYASNWILSNAVGRIGEKQIADLEIEIANRCNPAIVILHHHVGWYEDRRRDARDVMMCAIDGRALLEVLAKHAAIMGSPVLVLHGHKHMILSGSYESHGGVVRVHGCPSTTLGTSRTPTDPPDNIPRWIGVHFHDNDWVVSVNQLEKITC
jgi:predicted MPP superfamily phosphohydrolase